MPGIAAKDFNRGHGIKTSHVAGFEKGNPAKAQNSFTIFSLSVSSGVHPNGC